MKLIQDLPILPMEISLSQLTPRPSMRVRPTPSTMTVTVPVMTLACLANCNFIPDGRTTNKPIVLGLDVAPIAVPTGGTVTIESTGATLK